MKRNVDFPVRVVHGGHFPSFDGSRYRALIRVYLSARSRNTGTQYLIRDYAK